jgi:hypothetical protein
MPENVPLQDPPSGKAIVYLLRAPHDHIKLSVYFNEREMAILPAATYSAVVVEPGSYAVASSPNGRASEAPASSLSIKEGERRFLYVSAPTQGSFGITPILLVQRSFVPLVLPTVSAKGARVWKECNELDAQGFMSISKPVGPLTGAL